MMAARIFRGLESKQTRACAAHDSAPLRAKRLKPWKKSTETTLQLPPLKSVFLGQIQFSRFAFQVSIFSQEESIRFRSITFFSGKVVVFHRGRKISFSIQWAIFYILLLKKNSLLSITIQ